MVRQAKKGDTVRLHYTGRMENGKKFDSTEGKEPVRITLGDGWNMPGFDLAAEGLAEGEKIRVRIPPALAFGNPDPSRVFKVARASVPADLSLRPGMFITAKTPGGKRMSMAVAAFNAKRVLMDSNHPLAGKTLLFEIELVEIVGGTGEPGAEQAGS